MFCGDGGGGDGSSSSSSSRSSSSDRLSHVGMNNEYEGTAANGYRRCSAGNLGKIRSECGKHEVQYTECGQNVYVD